MNCGVKKKWWVCVVAMGLVFGVFGGGNVTLANPIVNGDSCQDLFNCLGNFDPPVDPGPGVEVIIHLDKTVFDLGETIEVLFEVTNNSLEAITVDTYFQYDAIVRIKNNDGNLLTQWPMAGNLFTYLRTTTIEPGVTINFPLSWDQFDRLHSPISQVEPGQYIIKGYTPFTTRDAEMVITITPEPTTGIFVMLALCGLMASRK